MKQPDSFCLSTTGSTRATAYTWSNKVLTLGDRTHIVWLDAVATVCGRTYDHASDTWSDIIRIGDGCDNHTCPCITADADGHIRLTYGPHGWSGDWKQARVQWTRSLNPNCLDAWQEPGDGYDASRYAFGYNATGASIVHTGQGLDAVVCRGGEHPPQTMFHLQRPNGGWTSARALFGQDISPQYTHHYGHITCGPDDTLYTATHFYNIGGTDNTPVTGNRSRMRSYGAGVLKSTDLGDTWTTLGGEQLHTPAMYDHRIAIPPLDANIYAYSITLDSVGTLWAVTLNPGLENDGIWLNRWLDTGWDTIRLETHLPENACPVEAMMTVDTQDHLHLVVTTVQPSQIADERHWGHASSEVFYLRSTDGGQSFEGSPISTPDPALANWLPSISRPGPHHPVDQPMILYTHGEPGKKLRSEIRTDVMCVPAGTLLA